MNPSYTTDGRRDGRLAVRSERENFKTPAFLSLAIRNHTIIDESPNFAIKYCMHFANIDIKTAYQRNYTVNV